MKWAYGITTVPERRYNYLPSTIASLKAGGFTHPVLFVDGPSGDFSEFALETVKRSSKIMAWGNWYLALLELWIRNPFADRYAIFQDDFITYKNLRPYLERCQLKDNQYWNLLTFPENESRNPERKIGWYTSNQRGRGAVGLVFPNSAVGKFISHPEIIYKSADKRCPAKNIDGTVVNTAVKLGIREMVHMPTLIHHTGDCSAIGNPQHQKPSSFKGDSFDALDLIPKANYVRATVES